MITTRDFDCMFHDEGIPDAPCICGPKREAARGSHEIVAGEVVTDRIDHRPMSDYRTSRARLRASIEIGVTVESDATDASGEAARRFRDHLDSNPEDFDWLASWLAGEGFGVQLKDFPILDQARTLLTMLRDEARRTVPTESDHAIPNHRADEFLRGLLEEVLH